MDSPMISEYYYSLALADYENSYDPEYHFTRDNNYRGYLIREYAKWLFNINECFDMWA